MKKALAFFILGAFIASTLNAAPARNTRTGGGFANSDNPKTSQHSKSD